METLRDTVTEIMSLGIRVAHPRGARRGGAGPAEGAAFLVQGRPVNVPVGGEYVVRSPYSVTEDGRLWKHGRPAGRVETVPVPRFYGCATREGVPCSRIALLHGKDCLATTVLQECSHYREGRPCLFCGTEVSLRQGRTVARKRPEQIGEVVRRAVSLDGVRHLVLTTGTGDPPGSELRDLAECTRAAKRAAPIPVHVQFEPPRDPACLDALRDAGVDTVGIHIETFDTEVLERVAPAKAALGLSCYERAWKQAVERFGPNQVSSFLIVGLGESDRSVVEGSELLADLGVYPFVVPLRPIPGSPMQHVRPPAPDRMRRIYEQVARILARKGLTCAGSRAGCVRCGACSGLPWYEEKAVSVVCHRVRNAGELAEARRIRKEVFVDEQKIFPESDLDEHDPYSTVLVAEHEGRIVGTVRIYPEGNGSGRWVGGRLAVRKDHRSSRVGEMLVREAVRQVRQRGATLFSAHIQRENVPFFIKLGWRAVGPLEEFCGRPHQLMYADLGLEVGEGWKERKAG